LGGQPAVGALPANAALNQPNKQPGQNNQLLTPQQRLQQQQQQQQRTPNQGAANVANNLPGQSKTPLAQNSQQKPTPNNTSSLPRNNVNSNNTPVNPSKQQSDYKQKKIKIFFLN
jgi:hypothetical protein